MLNLNKTSSDIPTLKMNNEYAEDNAHKEKMLKDFFISQTEVDDTNKTLPNIEALNILLISF